MTTSVCRLAMVCALFALQGCGGGGGAATNSNPTVAPPATTNVLAAYTALVRKPHTYSLSGSTSTGVSLTATLSIAQAAQVSWSTQTYDTALVTLSVYNGATLVGTGVTTSWQATGTPYWDVFFQSSDGSCTLRGGGTALPTSAALGQVGSFLDGTEYAGCSPSNMPMTYWISSGTVTQTWAYQAVGGTPFVCINTSVQGFVGTTTESDCVEIVDTSGTLGSRVRVTTTNLNRVTTTLTN